MVNACVAGMRSAVRNICRAAALPTRRGSRCVPPQPVTSPNPRARVPERRVVSGHAPVAGERQIQSAAQAEAANGRDHGQGKTGDAAARTLPASGELARSESTHGADFANLRARREGLFVRGNHHATEQPRAPHPFKKIIEFRQNCQGKSRIVFTRWKGKHGDGMEAEEIHGGSSG